MKYKASLQNSADQQGNARISFQNKGGAMDIEVIRRECGAKAESVGVLVT